MSRNNPKALLIIGGLFAFAAVFHQLTGEHGDTSEEAKFKQMSERLDATPQPQLRLFPEPAEKDLSAES